MPFRDRLDEWRLFQPLVGSTMLELGNKKNGARTYKEFFESLGYEHTSVDINGQDGALPLDLTEPLNLGQFDMVSNIGTSEHVVYQEPCWRNMLEAMHIGSVLVSTTPMQHQWPHHGDWYPTGGFYRHLARENGCELERLYVVGTVPRQMLYARLRRVEAVPFVMPAGGIWHNSR